MPNTQNWLKYKQMGDAVGNSLNQAKQAAAQSAKYNKMGTITSGIANMLKGVGDIVNKYEYQKVTDKLANTKPFNRNEDGTLMYNPEYKRLMIEAANLSGNPEYGINMITQMEAGMRAQNEKIKERKRKAAEREQDIEFRNKQFEEQQAQFDETMALERDKLTARKNKPYTYSDTPPAQASFDKKGGETFRSRLDNLPSIESRIHDLGLASRLADKVITSPVTGDLGVWIQSAFGKNSKEAQTFRHLLSKETVELIMKFAKEAGVRSIDTEKEQERLFRALANPRMSTAVIKDVLGSMQHTLNEAKRRVLEEKKHRESRKDFSDRGFTFEYRPYVWSIDPYKMPGAGTNATKVDKDISDLLPD